MKPRYFFPAIFALVLFALATAQEPQPVTIPPGSATIDQVKGDVSVHLPQAAQSTAQNGQVLPAETVIETNKGSIVLHLQDGSQLLVKPNSRIVLKEPASSEGHFFDLLLGKILAKVKKRLSDTPSFKMGTPTAVITVRGTQFQVEFSKKGTTSVEVYEGLVEVSGIGINGPPVLLQPGFGTHVRPNELPERPFRYGGEPGETGEGTAQQQGENRPGVEQPTSPQRPGSQQGGSENESEPH